MNPLVSVIVPVYKAEGFLDRCVESLVSQTYPHLEILLVEDGSPDASGALCDGWAAKDGRITVIHKENGGAGYARNSGLERASGDYLLFVDCDDYIDLATVERCVTEAQRTGADMVLFGRNNFYPDGRVKPLAVETDRCFFEGDAVREVVLPGLFTYERGMGVSVWGKLFRHAPVRENEVRFPSERETFSEDACFVAETFAHIYSVAFLRENLYYYCNNEGSLSRTYQPDYRRRNDAFLQRGLALCERFGYPPRVARSIYARYRIYALAGMKLVLTADFPRGERERLWQDMLHAPLLRQGVSEELLQTDTPSQRLLWRLYRWRLYGLCRLLLLHKSRR